MRKKKMALVLAGSILMTNVVAYAEMVNIEEKENLREEKIENHIPNDSSEFDTNLNDSNNSIVKDETNDDNNVLADENHDENTNNEANTGEKENIEYTEDDSYFDDFLNDFFQNDNNAKEDNLPSYDDNNTGLNDFIFDYEDESFDYFDPGDANDFFDDFNQEVDNEKNTTSGVGAMKVKKDKGPTIQYSLFSKNGIPVFIDTGLEVNKDKSISKVNIEELLRQISIKKQGKLFKDKNSFLLYINNDTLVISEKMFNTNDLEKAFENYDIKFKFSKSQAGRRSDLVDLLMTKGDIPVYIDNEKIELSVKPEASNELYVVFPIREIVEKLDGKILWNKEKKEVTINKNNKTIKINNKSNIVNVNGTNYKLATSAKLNNEAGRMLSLLSLIVNELDGVAYYDAHIGAITIDL